MGKSKLPTNNEWDKIVEEAFSSTEDHSFSENYKRNRDAIKRREIIMKNNKDLPERIFTGVCAAAVLAVVAVPASVVVKNRIKNGSHDAASKDAAVEVEAAQPTEQATILEVPDEAATEAPTEAKKDKAPREKLHKVLKCSWIPEGIKEDRYNHFYNDDYTKGFSAVIYQIDENTDLREYRVPFTAEEKEYDIGGKHIYASYADTFGKEGDNNRRFWVTFDDIDAALTLYPSDDISDDDINKIIENCELVENDEATIQLLTESTHRTTADMEEDALRVESGDVYTMWECEADKLNIFSRDTTVSTERYGPEGDYNTIETKLTDVYLTDSLAGVNVDSIGKDADFSSLMNEDGTLVDFKTDYYEHVKQPNGMYSYEYKNSESEKANVLVVELEYTNKSNNKVEICVDDSLTTINDGMMNYISEADHKKGLMFGYHTAVNNYTKLVTERHHMLSFSTPSDTKGSKNEVVVQPGETAKATLVYIVRESEIGNLYFRTDAYAKDVDSSSEASFVYLDLCDVKAK